MVKDVCYLILGHLVSLIQNNYNVILYMDLMENVMMIQLTAMLALDCPAP